MLNSLPILRNCGNIRNISLCNILRYVPLVRRANKHLENKLQQATVLSHTFSSSTTSTKRQDIKTQFIDVGEGKKLAFKELQGVSPSVSIDRNIPIPGIIFCEGFQSNMLGVKAIALEEYCKKKKLNYIRFDYSGCGESTGDLRDMTLSDWKRDTFAVIDQLTAGPQIMVGADMGGWLALLTALERPHRVHSVISIATAADYDKWLRQNCPEEIIQQMDREGSAIYDTDFKSMLLCKKFFDDSQKHSFLKHDTIPITCPVRLMHGMQDKLVPFTVAVELAEKLWTRDVEVVLRKSADHRFSQPEEIQLLFEMLDYLVYGAEEARRLAVSSWQAFSVYAKHVRPCP